MHDVVLEYFTGEKYAGLLVALVGLLAMIVSVFLFQPRHELRPFAVVLALMGLLELVVGVGLWMKTGPQVDTLLALHSSDPARMLADEGARMTRVQATFVRLEIVWLALIAISAVIALTQRGRPVLWCASLGFFLHASFLFVFDSIAERRGAVYLTALTHNGAPSTPAR